MSGSRSCPQAAVVSESRTIRELITLPRLDALNDSHAAVHVHQPEPPKYLYHRATQLILRLFSKLWSWIYILILLGLPLYYCSGVFHVFRCISTGESSPEHEGCDRITLSTHSSDHSGAQISSDDNTVRESQYPPHSILALQTGSLLKVQEVWTSYVDSRVAEWKVIFTLACIFATLSLTVFQIPQAINNVLGRTFASLAIYRAFASVVYVPIFLLYFRSSFTRTVEFAMLFSYDFIDSKFRLWNPLIMVSLPAASTLWALLLYLFTILSLTLHLDNSTSEDHHIPLRLSVALRIAITVSIMIDVLCLFGIWRTLIRYKYRLVKGANS